MQSLKIDHVNDVVYSILTIPQVVTEMNANLKAPIIINNKEKLGRQIVLQDSKLEVKFPMYIELKKYIVSYNSDDTKRTNISVSEAQPEETYTEIEAPLDSIDISKELAYITTSLADLDSSKYIFASLQSLLIEIHFCHSAWASITEPLPKYKTPKATLAST